MVLYGVELISTTNKLDVFINLIEINKKFCFTLKRTRSQRRQNWPTSSPIDCLQMDVKRLKGSFKRACKLVHPIFWSIKMRFVLK